MKKFFPTIILACLFLAGLLTFDQYGESWDDRSLQKYAEKSIAAYATFPEEGVVNIAREDLGFYGPFFVMLTDVLSKSLSTILLFSLPDLRHLIYYLTYFAGVLAFHSIAKHWFSNLSALGATLLFALQPVLWGHAFINPKDTPFLSLFLLSLSFGIQAFDKLEPTQPIDLSPRSKRTLTLLTALWLVSVFGLFIFTQAIHTYIETLVLSAQSGNTNILSLIAKNITAVSAETYTQRYFVLFLQLRTYYSLLITLALLAAWYKLNPNLPIYLFTILPAALMLGFATSTRILGPFAGLLITYYALRTKGKRAIPALFMYTVIALMATYISWPYLWMNPIPRFFESLREMSLYPWLGGVIFNGELYQSTNLPIYYLPVLLALQLTEPVWVLSAAGWVVSVLDKSKKRTLVEVALLWFVIPLLAFIMFKVALYDNFRQILFILPPIFLMAGVAFEAIKNVKWRAVLIAASLLPGLIGIISLHPYEYIYYNQFIGGVRGADGRFETDYWATSYREAAEYVNSIASPNANIWVEGPAQLFSLFAREDLKIYSTGETERAESYEYVVTIARYGFENSIYPGAEIVYVIERDGAVLTVVKKTR
ncbi:MAG: hypothetical protein C4557_05090 [Anaerolineaceae bacterium]|jgi:hypothetical protein|nr:MAG: hypothetical protein C4557_05090 [Anaerolineaceae bacterium]